LAQCAGVGCGLVCVVAGEEQARKVFSLEGPPGDGETSRLGSRDPVDGGTRCGPHGGETSKTNSWTIEPVHGGGRVKRLGVTEPPKIVPYYRLSLSTWLLSNNK
jgi:hypothetical protein